MSARSQHPGGVFGGIVGMLGSSILAGVLVAALFVPAAAVASAGANSAIGLFDNLPDYITIEEQPQENRIWATAADGSPVRLATVFSQNREEVGPDEVAEIVKLATIAGEDRRFYEHNGVDVQGLIRAALQNVGAGGVESGASTLSMQLVKNINIQRALQLPTEEERKAGIKAAQVTSIDRKLNEMKLAISLEKRYSKDEILMAYLNIAGFGGNTYGIEAAAQRYYATTAANLTLPQAASLIAIVQQPTARALDDPSKYAENKNRRDVILRNMFVEQMITQEELDEAIAYPVDETTVTLTRAQSGCIAALETARQFCDYVVKSIKDLTQLGTTPEEREQRWKIGGYDLYTSLNVELQATAQASLRQYANPEETRLALGASATLIEVGTGRILTMAQNKAFDDSLAGGGLGTSALNFNTDQRYGGSSGFQAGSTYKLFTLLNWLRAGNGLNQVVDANGRTVQQSSFADTCNGPWVGSWKFRNNANETGSRTVMAATATSINGAYISMSMKLDQCDTKRIAESLGVHTAVPNEQGLQTNPAAILGIEDVAPMTLAASYAAIANGGVYCAPIFVDRLIDASGTDLGPEPARCQASLVDAEVAAAAAYALQGAMKGYASNPRNGIPHMGKTGTTDSSKHTWIVSSTTEVASAIWVGNIVGDYKMRNYPNGGNLRHLIGKAILTKADSIYGGSAFPEPPQRLLTGTGVTVDDVIGQSPETARSIIEARGLVYAGGGQVDSDLPAGVVARTDPGAGAVASSGATVTVFTSNGMMAAIPSGLVGKEPAKAITALEAAGFAGAVTQKCVVDADGSGLVTSTSPAPGTVVRTDSAITLEVSRATCSDG